MMYQCGVCGKSFKKGENLSKHMASHTNVRPYKCSLCEKSFRARGHLNAHVLIHTGEKPFKCGVCGQEFNQNSNLKKHIRIHTGYRPYSCDVCRQTYTQQCYLKEHMKSHTGVREYGCTLCFKRFRNNNQLKAHMMTHSHEKPYKCTICGKSFKHSKNFLVHKIAHDNEITCYCSECGKEFRSESSLRKHMAVHQGIPMFECSVCGKEFSKPDNLKKHLVIHSGDRPYHCELCGKDFRTPSNLKSHMVYHLDSYCYSCELCEKKFKYKCNYSRHMKQHSGESSYACSICGSVFSCKSTFDSHRLVHINKEEIPTVSECIEDITAYGLTEDEDLEDIIHNIEEVDLEESDPLESGELILGLPLLDDLETKVPYKCTVCNKEYTTNTNLKLHMRNHSGERPFKCGICGKTFTQKSLLKVHMRSHTDERLYSCTFCSKSFKHSSHLHTHMRGHGEPSREGYMEDAVISVGSHVDEPVNSCNICGKTFLRKYILKRHMLVHSDKRAFSCSHCAKKFKENSHLKAHVMLHTGERPFDCDVCGKKFIQRSDQKRHMRTHSKQPSKGRPFTCTVCGLKFSYVHNLETHKIIHAMRKNKHCDDESGTDRVTNGKEDSVSEGFSVDAEEKSRVEVKRELEVTDEVEVSLGITEGHEGTDVAYTQTVGDEEADIKSRLLMETRISGFKQEVGYFQNVESSPINEDEEVLRENVRVIRVKQELTESRGNDENNDENSTAVFRDVDNQSLCRILVNTQVSEKYHKEPVCQNWQKSYDNEQSQNAVLSRMTKSNNCEENQNCPPASYECSICGLILWNVNEYRKHRNQHNDYISLTIDKQGKCPVCGKTFARISNLKRHLTVHTGERAFACRLCNKKFKEKGHLKTHELLVHSDKRPFQCDICGKRSGLKSDHKRHLRSHKGDKPFQCLLCGSKFATKRNLETHKIIHAMKKNRYREGGRNSVIVSYSVETNDGHPALDGSGMLDCMESEDKISVSMEESYLPHQQIIQVTGNLSEEKKFSDEQEEPFKFTTYTGTTFKPLDKRLETNSISLRGNGLQPIVKVFSGNHQKPLQDSPVKETSRMKAKNDLVEPVNLDRHDSHSDEVTQNIHRPVTEVQIGKITVQAIPYEVAQAEKIRKSNDGYNAYTCPVCTKMFTSKHNVKTHMRIHTGERPYKCFVCSKDFTQEVT